MGFARPFPLTNLGLRQSLAPFALLLVHVGTHSGTPGLRPGTLCASTERVVFACRLPAQLLSVCALPPEGQAASIIARLGPIRQQTFTANVRDGGAVFRATVSPAAPGALVTQLFWTQAQDTLVVSQCVGGSCPYVAGLSVWRDGRLLKNLRCREGAASAQPWFDPAILQGGQEAEQSTSATDLIRFESFDFDAARLFPAR